MWRTSLLLSLCAALAIAVPLADDTTTENNGPVIPGVSTDICRLGAMKSGALIACEAYIPMYTFNMQRGACEGFIYGGCGGSDNLFESREECEKKCGHHARVERDVTYADCSQPHESGRCLALLPRFAFDKESGECVQFMYGGCGGNANNFASEAACLARCKPERADRQLKAEPEVETIEDAPIVEDVPIVEEN